MHRRSSLAFLLARRESCGLRRESQRLFWLALAGFFLILSLGPALKVGGVDTGLSLPSGWLADIPFLWMLRKPDRFFIVAQLCLGVLVAFGWRDISRHPALAPQRSWLWIGCGVLLLSERAPIPLSTFETRTSPYLEELARSPSIRSLVDLPYYGGGPHGASYLSAQTVHGKKSAQGYVTRLAITPAHRRVWRAWQEAQQALLKGDAREILRRAEQDGIDLIIQHKATAVLRKPLPINGETIWSPFAFVRGPLMQIRQLGHFSEQPLPATSLEISTTALAEALGDPVFEDESIVVFERR